MNKLSFKRSFENHLLTLDPQLFFQKVNSNCLLVALSEGSTTISLQVDKHLVFSLNTQTAPGKQMSTLVFQTNLTTDKFDNDMDYEVSLGRAT